MRARIRAVHTSIRGRLTLLAIVAVGAFLLVSVGESLTVRRIIDQVEQQDLTARVHRIRSLFDRRANTKADLVSEFAFWDDAWRLGDEPRSAWARTFIRANFVEWLPTRYNDRMIEVWDRKKEPIFRWSHPSIGGVEYDIDHSWLFPQIDREKLTAGLVATPKGVLLLSGALILHSADYQLQGPSNGYVIAAQLVDSAMMREVGGELQEQLHILPVPAHWPGDSVAVQFTSSRDSLVVSFALQGLNGAPAALVRMESSRASTRRLFNSAYGVLAATALVGVLVIALLWRAGNRLVIRPLGEIARSLGEMQQHGRLTRLQTTPPTREWGLFVGAFNQTIDALQSSEERYQVLFDQAVDAYFLLDAGSQLILEANPAAVTLAGCPKDELVGHPFPEAIPLESSPDNHGTFRLKRRNGNALTVSVVKADLEIDGARRQLASLRDLTRNEELSAQLRQAQKMEAIGFLAGGVAHDFNNLLGAVLMATSSLREEVEGVPAASESIDIIEQASRRAAELTRRLLSFARREQQQTMTTSLTDVVTNVVRLCERTFDRSIRIEVDVADDLPFVLADPGQLEQALLNLCINARDAMPGGGVLRLSVETRMVDAASAKELREIEPGPCLVLAVSDTGLGLTAEAERHLFEPFFTTKGQGKGTGLGLAMVYGIVRNHNGAIRARNRPGRGVTFEIYLPVGSSTAAMVPHLLLGPPPGGTERILVIDDEAALRSVVSRALQRLGYTVTAAEYGRIGVDHFAADPASFDLVLLDIVMPEMGGAETFHRLRQIRSDVPVLVCSGYSADTDRQDLVDAGAAGFLEKPFDALDLARKVRVVLDEVYQRADADA
jgi:PAS domain S-box-containing protein